MAKKVNVSEFLRYYGPHAVVTNGKASSDPPASQYGYVMGGNGSVATDAYIKRRAQSTTASESSTRAHRLLLCRKKPDGAKSPPSSTAASP